MREQWRSLGAAFRNSTPASLRNRKYARIGYFNIPVWDVDSGAVRRSCLFVFFAISFVRPKGGVEWRTMGIFIGFIVALFTEMYGLPLTIYFLSQWLGTSYPVLNPFSHTHGHLWLVLPGVADSPVAMTILHTVSNPIINLGILPACRVGR